MNKQTRYFWVLADGSKMSLRFPGLESCQHAAQQAMERYGITAYIVAC